MRGLRSLIKTRIVFMVVVAATLGYWAAAGSFQPVGTLAAGIRFALRLDTSGSRLLLRVSVLYVPAMLLLSIADRFLPSM